MPSGSKSPTGVRRIMRREPTPASEYEEEKKTSRRAFDEDEPARPVNRRSRARDEDEEEPRRVSRRSSRDDEDDDEDDGLKGIVSTGWGGAKQLKAEMPSDFPQQFTVPAGDPVIIKFLEPEPFANYRQHWAEWLPKGSKLSYVCPKKDCPICAVGDKPSARFCFNIVDFTDPDNPINSVLSVGFKLSNVIEKLAQDRRTTPLDRDDLYFAINKTGSDQGAGSRRGGTVQTNIKDVKERDLRDDWDVEPLTPEDLDEFRDQVYTAEKYISKTPMKVLQEVADAYED